MQNVLASLKEAWLDGRMDDIEGILTGDVLSELLEDGVTKHYYEPGTTRWFRWPSSHGDPRGHEPPKGWTADAEQLDYHPITQRRLRDAPQWWVCETYIGETDDP